MNTLKFFSFFASVTDNYSRTFVYCIYRTGLQRVFKNKQNVTNNAKNWITFFYTVSSVIIHQEFIKECLSVMM